MKLTKEVRHFHLFRTLLLAWTGSTMSLALTPIWVRPVAVAMNLARAE